MDSSLKAFSDQTLLQALDTLVAKSRQNEADLLAYLAEVDRRRLYLEQRCTSMFGYCTEVLHFSEATAFRRISVARAALAYPLLLERIREGALHVAGAKLLAPMLTSENHVEMIELTRHKSKRAIEELLADRMPKPNVPTRIRRLPDSRPALVQTPPLVPCAPAQPVEGRASPAPIPLGAKRYKIQFTGSQALCDKLREAQGLLRHQIPDGALAEIFDRALTLLVDDAKRKKFAHTSRPRKRTKASQRPGTASRHIPADIKRSVSARDGGRCAFVAPKGRRCGSRDFLEFHHRDPWARRKRHSVDGIELRCRGHNHYAALQDFGAAYMARFTKRDSWSRDQFQVEQRRLPAGAFLAAGQRLQELPV